MILRELSKIDYRCLGLWVDKAPAVLRKYLNGEFVSQPLEELLQGVKVPYKIDYGKVSTTLTDYTSRYYGADYVRGVMSGKVKAEITKERLGDMIKVKELKAICKVLGLGVSGSKVKLIKSIEGKTDIQMGVSDSSDDVVRKIQVAEGNTGCFCNIENCGERACSWYEYCQKPVNNADLFLSALDGTKTPSNSPVVG